LGKVLIVALVIAVVLATWRVSSVFLLGFGGIVFAVALDNLAAPLSRRMPYTAALFVTVFGITVAFVLFFVLFGASAAGQFTALIEELPQAWVDAQAWFESWTFGQWVISMSGGAMQSGASALLNAIPIAGGFLGGLANAAFIVVIGIYLAVDSHSYRAGALRLLPPEKRKRAGEILDATGHALRSWLTAMTLDMLFLGFITGIGLWLVGVPLAMALGVLSGLSVFVPYIGPIVAIIPGLLLALSVSPELALYALGVYLVAQQLEGNIALPLLQRWTVEMPPALMLLAMVAFGLLFGVWGVLLATPLAVAVMTVVRMAYVEDVLEKGGS
jgi:predicted PurR-regulated permease PerM